MKRKISCVIAACFILIFTTEILAQSKAEDQHPSNRAFIKINSLSPTIGVELVVTDRSALRIGGFFSTNFTDSGLNNYYYLNTSFLIQNDWIASESVNTYMGIDLNLLFEQPVIAPGLLAGVSYRVHRRIAFFGEAGINLFLIDDANDGFLGMHNTGIGMRIMF